MGQYYASVGIGESIQTPSEPGTWQSQTPLTASGGLNENLSVGSPIVASGTANLITHTIAAYATGASNLAGTSAQEYGVTSQLIDTFTPNSSGVVHWGIHLPDVYSVVGDSFASNYLDMKVNASQQNAFSTGDGLEITEQSSYGPPDFLYGYPTTYTPQLSITGTYDPDYEAAQQITVWDGIPTLSFHAVAGDTYQLNMTLEAEVFFSPVPTIGGGGVAALDPQWFVTVPTGMTYTTSSGYQFAAVPEPTSVLAVGLGCAGLLLWRRRK